MRNLVSFRIFLFSKISLLKKPVSGHIRILGKKDEQTR
jgi:hypothetical protein